MVLFLIDSLQLIIENENKFKIEIEKIKNKFPQKPLVMIINKIDFLNEEQHKLLSEKLSIINYPLSISISAKEKQALTNLNTPCFHL